ncbi:MAG: beta-phosphoglucomutase family hydrolase [Chlamydiota bacterium]|nr:beta-phosphoglucomutase family hydrolase [Chlamydiota bacterium]
MSSPFKGAILDLDGVITQTAHVHFKAWKKTFEEYLIQLSGKHTTPFKEFTYQDDYMPYVDGKPRYQGVQSFLESRGIDLPYGNPTDAPDKESVCGLGNRKNVLFREVVDEDGVEIYPSTVAFVVELLSKGIKVGVASSSMNCDFILQKTKLFDLFKIIIGGIISKHFDLRGKPEPDIFLVAADSLNLSPHECLVVEDAISGVQAAKDGNFGLVIGVARKGNKQDLLANGADIAVDDLNELHFDDILRWFDQGLENDAWHLKYHAFEAGKERLRESLTTVGNGYFATRGAMETEKATPTHYPGTYIAGVYNTLPSVVYGKTIYNNDLVNCPNWLYMELSIGQSEPIRPLEMEILDYRHDLDMKNALLHRSMTFRDSEGRISTISSERFASMDNPHMAAIKYQVIPQNYSEEIRIRFALDGTITNYGVERYRKLNGKHLCPVNADKEAESIILEVQTSTSKTHILMGAKTLAYANGLLFEPAKNTEKDTETISEVIRFKAEKGIIYTVEKLLSIFTSKDLNVSNPRKALKAILRKHKDYQSLYTKHRLRWLALWDNADIQIEGDRFSQKIIRLHIYHLLVSASVHQTHIDAGMPARGLHGEAYRGHIFWDELFILPFYNLHFPEISRALLMYRYRRLDAAREYARQHGYHGAMYPWQTADDGKEETQRIHYNPISGKWDPDLSRLQRHVSIAIAYNIWNYYYCTNDLDFLYQFGAEMMLEIARFWAGIASFNPDDGRYHIRNVMGPDEFHEQYPNSDEGGIHDNAYTNIMTAWIMHKTVEMVDHLPKDTLSHLKSKIGFSIDECSRWNEIVNKMAVPIDQNLIISQFEGYMNLKEIDWEHYRQKYNDIHRLDRILKSEGDTPNPYKVAKQADVLMLFYMLSPGQIKHILGLMGYAIDDELELMRKNYEYYFARTSHGSTLSHVVHGAILKYLPAHRIDMWKGFRIAMQSDIYDTQGGTTSEGIHCGVMAGCIDIIMKSFAGIKLFKDHIAIEPHLPSFWKCLSFKLQHRGHVLHLTIRANSISIKQIRIGPDVFSIHVGDRQVMLSENALLEIPYTIPTNGS